MNQGHPADLRIAAAAAFDALPNPVLVFDAHGALRVWNQSSVRLVGEDALSEGMSGEAVGAALLHAGLPVPLKDVDGDAGSAFEGPRSVQVQPERLIRTDGRIWRMTSAATDDGGSVLTLQEDPKPIAGDAEILALLEDGLASLEIGAALWDATGVLRYTNSAWREQLGAKDLSGTMDGLAEMARHGPGGAEAPLMETPPHLDFEAEDGTRYRIATRQIASGARLATLTEMPDGRHSEARARTMLRQAAEPLREGIMLFDQDKRFVMSNEAAIRILFDGVEVPQPGLPVAEINRILIEGGVLPVPEGMSGEELNTQYVAMMEAFTQDFEAPLGDGRTIIASVYPTELGGYLVTLRDVTEARLAAEAARDNAEVLMAVVAASHAMICVARVEGGEILYASPSFYETFGRVEHLPEIYGEMELNDDVQPSTLEADPGETPRCQRLRDKSGRVLSTVSSSREILHRGERVTVVTSFDVTEVEAMREELRRQREIAHQNEKISALGELLAGVAHELSNPLSVIVGYAAMLRDDAEAEPVRRRADRVARAAERCVHIVRTFLAMARRRPANLQPCQVRDLVDTALMATGGTLRAQGIESVVDVPRSLPRVAADPDQIGQVLANLIQNGAYAMAAHGAGGRLTITARASGQNIDLTVQDTGGGVPDELRHRLFEPFFTTKPVGEGTGIGLAFCHRVATAHGGLLTLDEDAAGPGATFRLRLPQAQQPPAPVAQSPAQAVRNLRVLLLDDEPEILVMSRAVFERAGHRVSTATRAEDALRLCSRGRFDAILCDARMPGIDGPGFLRLLREVAPDQVKHLAFVTGDAMNPAMLDILQATFRPLVEKPVAPQDMLAIASALAGGEA